MASEQPERHPLQPFSGFSSQSGANDTGVDEDVFPKPQRSWNPLRRRTTTTSFSSDFDYVGYQPADSSGAGHTAVTPSQSPDGHGHENDHEANNTLNNNDGGMKDVPSDPYIHSHSHSRSPSDTLPGNSPSASWFLNDPSGATLLTPPNPGGAEYIRCPTSRPILHGRSSRVPLTILILAIYCTLLSGLYVVVAIWKPRYGRRIGEDGGISASNAALVSAILAKTIELSFVTVFVAFLGQVLSRSAITRSSNGISLSDISMRGWITQPGALIVNWKTLRYSALTVPGVLSLMAMVVAFLYTTAAEALVSPKLTMGQVKTRELAGNVYSQYASTEYIKSRCSTPITSEMDHDQYEPDSKGSTCAEIEHAGQAYHNYYQYLSEWGSLKPGDKKQTTNLSTRLQPIASIFDNTSVAGSWIDIQDMQELSAKHRRMVLNVTAALPHGNVVAAAQDGRNQILQPHDPSGEGKYNLEAAVPSPAINVLCVGMTAEELAPIIYKMWPGGSQFDATSWDRQQPGNIPAYPDWLNRTAVDDIFGFGPSYGQRPPIFGKLPHPYNTIANTTVRNNGNAVYILATSPTGYVHPNYTLCALRSKLTGVCSTQYSAAASGAKLTTRCEDSHNKLQYNRHNPQMTEGSWKSDWKNVASLWTTALNLNAGITDGAASNARFLSEMVPQAINPSDFNLNKTLPSIAEALAVMAGSTLILSSQDSPFVPMWNYSKKVAPQGYFKDGDKIGNPTTQWFTGTLQAMDYSSGPSYRWQCVFYVILLFAFVTSAICLVFILFKVHAKQITDFTEPLNLFALAVNSPATTKMQGACGAGPAGTQLKERWYVGMDEESEHYYIRPKAEEDEDGNRLGPAPGFGVGKQKQGRFRNWKWHRHQRSGSSVMEGLAQGGGSKGSDGGRGGDAEDRTTPRVREYRGLSSSKRSSWLF